MATLPTPLRAVLGLAATALDEARKLPETLPQAPVVAVSTAMQVSLRVQQRIAELAARGDEVLSQLRGTSSEPPEWATFDEAPESGPTATPNGSDRGLAAFDRVPDGAAGEPPFEVTETGAAQASTGQASAGTAGKPASRPRAIKVAGAKAAGAKATSPKPAGTKAAGTKAAGTKAAGTKASSSKPAGTKASSSKPAGTKAAGAKTTAGRGSTGKTTTGSKPANRVRAGAASEPLADAASRVQPANTPNPVTMAAEIVRAKQANGAAPTGPEAGSGAE